MARPMDSPTSRSVSPPTDRHPSRPWPASYRQYTRSPYLAPVPEADPFESAACLAPGVDADLFFPADNAGGARHRVARAKAVCARCPLSGLDGPCYAAAERGSGHPDGFAIAGGYTAGERQAIRRARRSAA